MYNDFEPFNLDKENNLVYAENPLLFPKKEIDDKSIVLKLETEHSISSDGRLYINLVNLTNEKIEFTLYGKGNINQKLQNVNYFLKIYFRNIKSLKRFMRVE